MKILVIGNIGSGKTTLIEKERKTGQEFISIDQMRKQTGDGSFSQEMVAWSHFLRSCEMSSRQVTYLEFSGAGPHKHQVRQSLINSNDKVAVVYLQTPVEICKQRLQSKTWDTPYPWDNNPVTVLDPIHQELEDDLKEEFWKHSQFRYYTIDGTSINGKKLLDTYIADLMDYEHIEYNEVSVPSRLDQNKIVKIIRDIGLQHQAFEALLKFGSDLDDKNTWRSDVDLAIISNNFDETIKVIKHRFSHWLSYDIVRDNRVMLYLKPADRYPPLIIKLDLYVVPKVGQIARYIRNKIDIDTIGTKLIEFDKTGHTTHYITNSIEQISVEAVIKQRVSEFIEYFELLSRTHYYGDQYRYYFYLNLSYHQIIVLNHIVTGKLQDHYLPQFTFSNYEFDVEEEYLPKMEPDSNPRIGNRVKKDYIEEFISVLAKLKQQYSLHYDIQSIEDFLFEIRERDYFWNFRDVATSCTKHIKENHLYRTSTLSRYRNDEKLKYLLDRLEIKAVIDLRYDEEKLKYPYDNYFKTTDIEYISTPIKPDQGLKHKEMKYVNGTENYYELFPRYMTSVIKSIFRHIATVPVPASIHCYVGRDRTGMIVAMLHKLLGCSDQEVIQDYINSHMNTNQATIHRTLLVIQEMGGIENYLLNIGLTQQEINTIREKYGR